MKTKIREFFKNYLIVIIVTLSLTIWPLFSFVAACVCSRNGIKYREFIILGIAGIAATVLIAFEVIYNSKLLSQPYLFSAGIIIWGACAFTFVDYLYLKEVRKYLP